MEKIARLNYNVNMEVKNRGEKWTDEEIQEALRLYKAGTKISEISREVSRSESAVHKKINEYISPDRKTNWTEKEIETAVTLYNEGKSNSEISRVLGKSLRSVQAKLVRLGYKRKDLNVWADGNKRADFWTGENIEELKAFVNEGLSCAEISDKIGRSKKAVFCKMGELGLKILPKTETEESNYRRAYDLDDDYFETIDTQTKAYFLGWMITDGYVGDVIHSNRGDYKSGRIGLKLQKDDVAILEHFKKELKLEIPLKHIKPAKPQELTNKHTGKIYTIRGGEHYELDFSSAKMQKDLARYGVVPRKTYDAEFPKELNEKFYPGFIAGVISGDGSVDVKKNHKNGKILRSSVCGTLPLVQGIKNVLVKAIGFNSDKKILKSKGSKALYILELSQGETIRLQKWLKGNGISLMPRKDKIIEDYLNERPDLAI